MSVCVYRRGIVQSDKVEPDRLTTDGLKSVLPGGVIHVYTRTADNIEVTRYVRRLTPPITEPMRVWASELGGGEQWIPAQVMIGHLVFDHAGLFGPRDWRCYRLGQDVAQPIPAALIYSTDDSLAWCARLWWGEPGQDPAEFMVLVMASLRSE